ncbi:MAG: hypothetical protein EON85_12220 [Brevundimonas sp.]|nr:MAG: hypothetical protein EON85_12220 [Brevundimonas sp.]
MEIRLVDNGYLSTALDGADLGLLAALLTTALPDPIRVRTTIEHSSHDRSCLNAWEGRYGMWQTFIRTEDRLEVGYDGFFLPDTLRNQGIALETLRQSLIAYDILQVDAVQFEAVDDGAYTWAYWGGIVRDPAPLREGLSSAPVMSSLSERERNLLERVLNDTSDDLLMYDLARLKTESDARLGRRLLTNRRWIGFVDLNDAEQRARIAGALSERT